MTTLDGIKKVRAQAIEAASAAELSRGSVEAVLAWTRALVPSPCAQVPPKNADGTWHWEVRPEQMPVDGLVYSDASQLDGPDPLLGRFGWSFTIVDEAAPHAVRASAFGTPPDWIDNMNAAEAWAIQMAITVAVPLAVYTADSLEFVRAMERGKKWVTAAARPNARVWGQLCTVFDSEVDIERVRWMPSHKSEAQAGRYLRSDGQRVTLLDVRANAIADKLAKRGAESVRVPDDIRATIAAAEAATVWVARTIGHATWAANHATSAPHRDAEPDEGWQRKHGRQRRRRPARLPREPRPVALGGHRLRKTSDGWKCDTCNSRSIHWGRIAPSRCPGAAVDVWARRARVLARARRAGADGEGGTDGAGHVSFLSDRAAWCDRCGAYADAFAVGLAKACAGRPQSDGKHQHLRRLRRGCHPAPSCPHPSPSPLSGLSGVHRLRLRGVMRQHGARGRLRVAVTEAVSKLVVPGYRRLPLPPAMEERRPDGG